MPTYTVRDPTSGKTVKLTGDSPPTEAELEQIFAKLNPAAPAKPTSARDRLVEETLRAHPHPLEGVTDEMIRQGGVKFADSLPTIGGTVGGLIGGSGGTVLGFGVGGVPGAIGGAAIGGAGGEGLRQLVRRGMGADVPDTASEAAKDIAIQGGTQAAYEAGGQAIAAAAKPAAKWLMNRALNLRERLALEFPELSQTMIDRGLTVSQNGYKQARQFLMQAKAQANAAVQAADAAGARVPITAATQGLNNTLKAIQTSADIEGGLRAAVRAERQVMAGRGADMTVAEADALKTSLQREARSLYQAARGPNGKPALNALAQAKADMATALNDAIEAITSQMGPGGYRAANAEAQQMIGATRGIRQAIRPGSNLYQAMVRPGVGAMLGGASGYQQGGPSGGALGAAVGAVATSPGTMSREALILANPAFQALLKQLPRSAALSITEESESRGARR